MGSPKNNVLYRSISLLFAVILFLASLFPAATSFAVLVDAESAESTEPSLTALAEESGKPAESAKIAATAEKLLVATEVADASTVVGSPESAKIAATTAKLSSDAEVNETAELEGFNPLSPDEPEVDASRIVAWPKENVSSEEIEESIADLAEGLDTAKEIELISNPEEDDSESLVIVEGDPESTEDLMEQMMASGLYEVVDYDVLLDPLATYKAKPNDKYYADKNLAEGSWGLGAFPGANFSELWARLDLAKGKPNTAPIAVIDTGFDLSLEDRGSNIVAGYDFALNKKTVTPQSKTQIAYHGTSTAGVIGAATNNKKGVAGAAWDNRIIVYKATDANNNLYLSTVTNSINDVVEKRNARIINMSLGGTTFPAYFQKAIDAAVDAGILVIAAAGNTAQSGNVVLYPAAYSRVLSVASIGPTGKWSNFSTYNSGVDIAAPGEQVAVMRHSNTYSHASGTSFAAPHVSAAAALIWRASPELSALQVRNLLTSTAKPIGARGNTKTGAGALDADAAYELALGLPYQPKITKVTRGDKSVKLSWSCDTQCNRPVTGYILQYRSSNQEKWTSVTLNTKAKNHSYTVQNLKEGKKYYFRIATVNDKGKGPVSASVASTTYPLSIKSTKSTVEIKKGKTVTIRVAPQYCTKKSVKVNWSSSKPKIASISTMGKDPMAKGKGSWSTKALTDSSVAKNGKKLTIKGLKKGTCYITFTSGTAKCKVKVIVN